MFFEDDDLDSISDKVTCYINYCVESVIPRKQIKVFPNNKPWVTRAVKAAINRKKAAFISGDRDQIKTVQKELKRVIKQSKVKYEERVEEQMSNCNTWGLWNGMTSIAGNGTKNDSACWSGLNVNEVNTFFARFDDFDFSASHDMILESLVQRDNVDCSPEIVINENDVRRQLKCLKTNKAAGPDGVHPRTLKVCDDQLCSVFQ